jgi:hypothetical protein
MLVEAWGERTVNIETSRVPRLPYKPRAAPPPLAPASLRRQPVATVLPGGDEETGVVCFAPCPPPPPPPINPSPAEECMNESMAADHAAKPAQPPTTPTPPAAGTGPTFYGGAACTRTSGAASWRCGGGCAGPGAHRFVQGTLQ